MIDLDNIGQVREAAQAAYMAGNIELSNAYEALADSMVQIDALGDKLDDAVADSIDNWRKHNGDPDDYMSFFYDCFEFLTGHYPCPSITSEYDKSVIFETIEKGAGL